MIPVPVQALQKRKQKLNTLLLLVERRSESMVSIILHPPAEEGAVHLVVQPQGGVAPVVVQGMEGWEERGGRVAGVMG